MVEAGIAVSVLLFLVSTIIITQRHYSTRASDRAEKAIEAKVSTEVCNIKHKALDDSINTLNNKLDDHGKVLHRIELHMAAQAGKPINGT